MSHATNLEPQAISRDILLEKYAKGDEQDIPALHSRVAKGLAAVENDPTQWTARFLSALASGFIPAGRIMSSAGTNIQETLINCFVQPVGDCIQGIDDNGNPGIYEALKQAAETMRRGGGVGYDFSFIRPKGAKVKGTSSSASGPVSYMRVFDRSCETVESAGARRGAQMGVLRCDHPDILEFVHAKDAQGELTNFNISVGVVDAFMKAVTDNADWRLVHIAEPSEEKKREGAFYDEENEVWVYRAIPATELYRKIIGSTYDHAEPGILFLDRMNAENNLWYVEELRATNPCGEQPLPAYGCCCLGSINLTKFVEAPFGDEASFNYEAFKGLVKTSIRMLDNVLEATYWPLDEQRNEALSKRRVGLGYTGLGDALVMLGLRYDADAALSMAASISETMRDAAYGASVELAKERGTFPLFNADKYLESEFTKRLPKDLRAAIRAHGIRNSHLLSIAPTGTISLAFADNTSTGIEPPFWWTFERKKRQPNGSKRTYPVEDHAYRVYRESGGDVENLPEGFVTTWEIAATDHIRMLEVVQPFVDTSISKTVNVPIDYPFEDFATLYLDGWKAGLKGLATFRPNRITGSVLSSIEETPAQVEDLDETDPDRRIRIEKVPKLPLSPLRWERRPRPKEGNPSWTYLVKHPYAGEFAVFVGHIENDKSYPFEVWINGAEQPRGLGALAKSLSMDMRSEDRGWLKTKLESLSRVVDAPFDMLMPDGSMKCLPGTVATFAQLVEHRVKELGAFDSMEETPLLDALLSRKEPKTGPDGTMSWTVDIFNPATDDDFVLGVKELTLPDGQRRPYSVWMAGNYPRAFDGLCITLSFDMRIYDPEWIGKKLRQLLDYAEPLGDFMARVPGEKRQMTYPSTVAYIATLLLHRYVMLGILDREGAPIENLGALAHGVEADQKVVPIMPQQRAASVGAMEVMPGRRCPECGSYTVIKEGGCDFCTSCGYLGACG